MKRTVFSLFILMLIVVASCGKTVEKETQSWERNSKKITELSTLYPGFKDALNQQRQNAKASMDAAWENKNKEQAAKQMSEANRMLVTGLAGDLREIDRFMKEIRSKLVDLAAASTDESDRDAAKTFSEEAKRVLVNMETKLKQGAPELAAAQIITKNVLREINAVKSDVDKLLKSAQTKKKQAEATKTAQKTEQKKDVESAKTAASPWKCEYCGSLNPPDQLKCKSCGATKK